MKYLPLLVLVTSVSAWAGVESQPLPNFSALLLVGDEVVVYEGLPRPVVERRARDEALRTKQTMQVGTEVLYEQPLTIPADDQKALTQIFRSGLVGRMYRGEKFCGGFHADYMIEWRAKETVKLRVLLCFGCDEMQLLLGDEPQHVDMSDEGREAILALVKKSPGQRPDSKYVPVSRAPTAGAVPLTNEKLKTLDVPPPALILKH